MALLTNEQVATLLGRPLSESELTSFDAWEAVAEARLGALLCTTLTAEELSDIQALLLARMFAVISDEAKQAKTASDNYGITSKKVEDFSVNFGGTDASPAYAKFARDNADLIALVSQCEKIRIGKVKPLYVGQPL